MEIKESIAYLRHIADSAHLKQYSAALDTAIRCMEEVGELKQERDAWVKAWCKEHNRAVNAETELRDERDRFDRLTDFELAEAKEMERVKRERNALRNELCLWCNHRLKHPDACDHCRWKED